MSPRVLPLLTLGTSLGCGLIAGVFFAFSSFVMPALMRLPSAQGIAAMQSINVTVINRVFLGAFLGTAVACLALVVLSLSRLHEPGARLRAIGAVTYLLGTMLVTVVVHIPRNEALAALDPTSPASAEAWAHFLAVWMPWNHLRGLAALCAAALLSMTLLRS